MGLLDNLFKPKPDAGGERIAEGSTGAGGEGSSENPGDLQGAPGAAPKPAQFLAPKNYVPRSSMQIVPPTRGHPQPERKAVSPEPDADPQMAKEIVLTLGDVLSQIPFHFLRQGMWDVRRELRFPAEGLAADIARGRALVSLTDIVVQCPAIFVTDAEGLADVPIRLPLQKLVEQIGITTPAAYAAAQPVATTSSELLVPAVSDNQPLPVAATPGVTLPEISFSGPASRPAPTAAEQIHLSLAAILKRCPPEIIVRPLPPVDESVRVTFPFMPIERQLASGRVEVSS
ncbi:MAG TPA: hypothetical protein VFD27_12070, partial [Chthoniobacteraceae bacterium]|nr:hypothetical protein [Chthoniobacteraceae bacterium]